MYNLVYEVTREINRELIFTQASRSVQNNTPHTSKKAFGGKTYKMKLKQWWVIVFKPFHGPFMLQVRSKKNLVLFC